MRLLNNSKQLENLLFSGAMLSNQITQTKFNILLSWSNIKSSSGSKHLICKFILWGLARRGHQKNMAEQGNNMNKLAKKKQSIAKQILRS